MSLITRLDNFRKKYYKREITINEIPMHYYLCGKGDHVLVLLQGDLGMPEQWMNYIEDLSGVYRILAPAYPEGIDTTEELCSALRSLLRFLHIDRAVFVGDGYGGYLAQLMAIRYPEITEALCLFSTAGLQEDTLRALRRQGGRLRRTAMAYRLMSTSKVRQTERKQFLDAAAAGGCDDLSGMGLFFDEMCRDLDQPFALHMLALRSDIPELPPCSREQFAYLDRRVLLALPDNDEQYTSDMQLDLIADMPRPKMLNGLWKGHLSPIFQSDVVLKGLRRFLLTLDKEPKPERRRGIPANALEGYPPEEE